MIQKRKQRNYGSLMMFLVLLAVIAFLGVRWISFERWRSQLPVGMTVQGVPVEGISREEALARLQGAYDGYVSLHYQDETFALAPQAVGFQVDMDATAANLAAELATNSGAGGFLKYLLGQHPGPVDVPASINFSSRALRGFLTEKARDFDRAPRAPVPQPATGDYTPGEPGRQLNVEASMPVVAAALLSTSQREALLVVDSLPPPLPGFSLVSQIIENELASFPGIASVFAKDLQTGDEIAIDAGVAFAGMSIIKIAIMTEAYRYLDRPPDVDTTKILTETMTLSGNFTANLLLKMIGQGNAYTGVEVLNSSMHRLGLINTFMATPYDEDVVPPVIITEANARTDLNTDPDPYMQTTPTDIGLLLEMVYQCSEDGGTLLMIYPDEFTADECQAMIGYMLANRLSGDDGVPVLIAAGLPKDTPIAHKHGWVADTRADAALVFTPGGDFVLVIYLYQPGWVDWDQTNSIMTRISQLFYAYFNPPSGS